MDSNGGERYSFSPVLKWNTEVEEYFVKAYGRQQFERICRSLMTPPVYTSIRINTMKTSTEEVIQKLKSVLRNAEWYTTRDVKATQQIKSSTINSDVFENNCVGLQFEDIFEQFKDKVLPQNVRGTSKSFTDATVQNHEDASCHNDMYFCNISGLEYILAVKGSGPFNIAYDTKCGNPIKEVVVSRKCAEAVLRGADVFVPGVMACSSHVEKGDMVAVSVALEQPIVGGGWTTGFTRGAILTGETTDPGYFQRTGLYIGCGIAMLSRTRLFREVQGIAIKMVDRVYELPPFYGILKGDIFLQNFPSIITAHVLDPMPGERILDLCAAPGGKTTAIAILMEDKGKVIATDRSHNKVEDIKNLVEELGLTCVHAYKLDALKAVKKEAFDDAGLDKKRESMENESTKTGIVGKDSTEDLCCGIDEKVNVQKKGMRKMRNGPGRSQNHGTRVCKSTGFEPASFDRVLLDAPCSALGLRPRLFAGEETLESLRRHSIYQRRMFDQAVQLVRPGGIIVYSTCTINPGENEAVVRYALDKYEFLSLEPQRPKIGGPGLVGGVHNGEYCEEWLRDGEQDKVQRFDPSSGLDTIGFFIAKFKAASKFGIQAQ